MNEIVQNAYVTSGQTPGYLNFVSGYTGFQPRNPPASVGGAAPAGAPGGGGAAGGGADGGVSRALSRRTPRSSELRSAKLPRPDGCCSLRRATRPAARAPPHRLRSGCCGATRP